MDFWRKDETFLPPIRGTDRAPAPQAVLQRERVRFPVLHAPVPPPPRPAPTTPTTRGSRGSRFLRIKEPNPVENYSPGSRIPRSVGVHAVPVNTRAAPRAGGERGQGDGRPLGLPTLTREEPLARPEEALGQASRLLQDEEWERKTEGLRLVRALAEHHHDIVIPELHQICTAVIQEVKNLRSVVSRDAINTMAHLFSHLQRAMDREVVRSARALLNKAGEANMFIKNVVELALSAMVQYCSPGRVLRALLDGGVSHRNANTRASASLHLMRLVQVMGASRVLTGRGAFTSQILPAISTLALDSSQEVRLHARTALGILGGHKDACRLVQKYAPPRDQTSVLKLLG